MNITTILFDLDGTLLPMDQDEFTKGYFKLLAAKLAPYGYDPKQLIDAVWAGTYAMVKNDGSCLNEEAFWKKFTQICGEKAKNDEPIFREFYEKEFQAARKFCGYNQKAFDTVQKLKQAGFRVVLATNPLFPAVATESRIRWAGLEPTDFELYTTYENTCYCKPNPDYYRDLLKRLDVSPSECLMVGNDVTEDMVAETVGIHVFLLADCLINKENKDISVYPHGNFDTLLTYIQTLT
ncbi:MAG: HAD family hydrolase [Lachnospiraceae bacterium]